MSDNPIAFRPSPKAFDALQKYRKINGLQGKGMLSKAMNQILESLGKDRDVTEYVHVEVVIQKHTLKSITVSLLNDSDT